MVRFGNLFTRLTAAGACVVGTEQHLELSNHMEIGEELYSLAGRLRYLHNMVNSSVDSLNACRKDESKLWRKHEGPTVQHHKKATQSYNKAKHEAKRKQCHMLDDEYDSTKGKFEGLLEKWDELRSTGEGKIVVVQMAKEKDPVCGFSPIKCE
jgi:hypothetical protein